MRSTMFTCTTCATAFDDDERSPVPGRCRACHRRRLEVAAAELALATAETVLKLPAFEMRGYGFEIEPGWVTARCVHDIPTAWLCLHIHATKEEAATCLAATQDGADGR
jgi:DNA-directed RNA polymerase subunit RPC12/RpoP